MNAGNGFGLCPSEFCMFQQFMVNFRGKNVTIIATDIWCKQNRVIITIPLNLWTSHNLFLTRKLKWKWKSCSYRFRQQFRPKVQNWLSNFWASLIYLYLQKLQLCPRSNCKDYSQSPIFSNQVIWVIWDKSIEWKSYCGEALISPHPLEMQLGCLAEFCFVLFISPPAAADPPDLVSQIQGRIHKLKFRKLEQFLSKFPLPLGRKD